MKHKAANILSIVLLAVGCTNQYSPRPAGYMRIDLPEKRYILFDSSCPYRFEYPDCARIEPDRDKHSEPHWINISYPSLRGKIHISYKNISRNLAALSEESRDLAYKHTIKAESIIETRIHNREKKVYGILYDIQGNVASTVQFILTDSSKNFLRGSLYFYVHPNKDSLMPMVKYCRADIEHMIQTFEWK